MPTDQFTSVTARAHAKVNLHLGVGDLRDDGFHELTTIFQSLSLYDDVHVRSADSLAVHVFGEGAREVPTDRRNLVWKAAASLAHRVGRTPDVEITISKHIPVAAGLAGGSADAAATLVALNALWGLDLSRNELSAMAAELGSDVPFALHGGTAVGTGRGEQLLPVLCRSTFHWVLAFDREGLSTPTVFAELDRLRELGTLPTVGRPDDLLQALAAGVPIQVAELLGNDLQTAAISLRPTLRRTLRAGQELGALRGIVSGSGPSCAFLCADEVAAAELCTELSGAGVARAVRVATGPAAAARVVNQGGAAPNSHGPANG